MTPAQFRPGRGADIEWCAQLMSGSQPWLTLGRDISACREVLTHPQAELILAWREDQPAGFVLLRRDGWLRSYIQSLAVHPDEQGAGVGSALIRYAEGFLFEEGPNIFISVSSFNHRAQALYLRLGYQPVGVLRDYLRAGYDEILMRKTKGPLLAARAEVTQQSGDESGVDVHRPVSAQS